MVSLHTPSLRGGPECVLVAWGQAVVHVDDRVGQAGQFSPAGPFPADLPARCPPLLPPGCHPAAGDAHRVLAPLPPAPQRPAALPSSPTPGLPAPPPRSAFPPTASRSCPRPQTCANGRPSLARTVPPATPLFPRVRAIATGQRTRARARMVSARSLVLQPHLQKYAR
jgi:hypothetical protein